MIKKTFNPAAQHRTQFRADAMKVVTNPDRFSDHPLLRRLAWATLMAERDRKVVQDRLASMKIKGDR